MVDQKKTDNDIVQIRERFRKPTGHLRWFNGILQYEFEVENLHEHYMDGDLYSGYTHTTLHLVREWEDVPFEVSDSISRQEGIPQPSGSES